MTVPVVPGDRDFPTDWWTERDEMILRGELEKLADIRPNADAGAALCFCRPGPGHLPGHRNDDLRGPLVAPLRTWNPVARGLGAAALLGLLVLVLLAASAVGGRGMPAPCPGDPAGCADFATPTTYGPPGPAGGFTSMPVRGTR